MGLGVASAEGVDVGGGIGADAGAGEGSGVEVCSPGSDVDAGSTSSGGPSGAAAGSVVGAETGATQAPANRLSATATTGGAQVHLPIMMASLSSVPPTISREVPVDG